MKQEKKEEAIARFKSFIPQRITVQIEKNKDEDGMWAKVLDLPHCYTQASSINKLPSMLTDLVLTHFEVPEKYRKEFGQYVPVPKNHLKMEEMFRRLIEIETRTSAGEEVKELFSRTEAVSS